ncbi:DUF1841 family protein [Saccharopolyspora spinosa]|uniref:DUF1841 family protein n=1 Tax=Saccharopolyspora spinosa TaxID=60894 RepID=UPI00030C18A9|nr:DUF1841 family protein [Saccharopolyspora spinosa]
MSRGRKRKPMKSGRSRQSSRSPGYASPPGPPAEGDVDPAAYLDDVPPSADKAEVESILDRRMFTVAYQSTVIDGERFDWLNPADPDERALLIKGEHPEYHESLADPLFEGELDGHSPRLHLTMHEVIANQLWDDDPPEVWQAARRLRDQGMNRHDILHRLAAVLTKHMYPVLAKHEQFDTEAYRRALNELHRE